MVKRFVGMWIFYLKFNVILDTFKSRTCYQVIKDKWFSVILKSPINAFSTSLSKDRKISLSLMNNVENLDF